MKKIHNQKLIEQAKQELSIHRIFSSPELSFFLVQYEKGEMLTDPVTELTNLLLIWSGSVSIYGLSTDARMIPVGYISKGTLIGDIEYVTGSNVLFGEASDTVLCLALSMKEHRSQLDSDVMFLRHLTKSLAQKVYYSSESHSPAIPLEEKVLYHMQYHCPNHILSGVGNTCMKLGCSRRQLQRILAGLCTSGRIQKIKKGSYQLL